MIRIIRYNFPSQDMLRAVLSLRSEFGDENPQEPFVNFITRRLEDEKMLLIVAVDDETPVGYGLAFDVNEHPYMPEWTRAGYISQFLVSENYRKHGVGKTLMSYINVWFDSRGINKVLLNVDVDNEAGNRFWKSQGFKPSAIRMKRVNK